MPSPNHFSTQFKLMAFTSGLSLLTTFVFMGGGLYLFDFYTEVDRREDIQRSLNIIRLSMNNILQRIEGYTGLVANDRHLAQLIVEGDHAALETEMVARYQHLNQRDGTIRTVEVTDDKGVVVLRGHNPGRKGDDKSQHPQVRTALNGQSISGLTVSPTTNEVAQDAVFPIRLDDRIVGTFKIGSYLRVDTATYLKNLIGVEVAFWVNGQIDVSTLDGLQANALTAILAQMQDGDFPIVEIGNQSYNMARHPLSVDVVPNTYVLLLMSRESLEQRSSGYLYAYLSLGAGLVILALGVSALIARQFTRRLGGEPDDIAYLAKRLSEGDLTVEFDHGIQSTGIYAALRETEIQLKQMVGQIKAVSHQVNQAAAEIAQGNTDLSKRTESQAASLEETAASMEQITSTVKQSAANALQADQLAVDACRQAQHGGQVVQQAVEAMQTISESSHRIANIINVIDEIAFQTNLLALNAAVEAARAGEQGRGFAVVAGEVRNLAQRSADAAREIKDLITDSVAKVESGSRLVQVSGKTLREIVDSVQKVTTIVAEITAATREQASGIEQVNQAISSMDEVTQQNAALVEQVTAASQAMSEQVGDLERLIAFFKLDEAEPKNAHSRSRRALSSPAD